MRTNSIGRPSATVVMLLLAAMADAATIEPALPDPGMLGEWVLDADHSEDVGKRLRDRLDAGHDGPPGGGLAGGPPPGGVGPPPGDGPPEGPGDGRGPGGLSGHPALDRELASAQSFQMRVDAGRISLVYGDRRPRIVHDPLRDQRVVSASGGANDGEFGYSFAYREGRALVVETPRGSGASAFEYYELSADGETLHLTLRMTPADGREDTGIHRVFVRRSASTAAETAAVVDRADAH